MLDSVVPKFRRHSVIIAARFGEGQLFLFFRSMFIPGLSFATEIIVLRQQFPVFNSTVKRPQLRRRDRLFWVCLSRLW
jgi:hypothetical protein